LDSVKTQFLTTAATQQAANWHAENDVALSIVAFTSHLRTREVAGMFTLGVLSSAVSKYTQLQHYD